MTPSRAVTARDAIDGGPSAAAGGIRRAFAPTGEHARHGLQVEADTEVGASRRHDDGAYGAVGAELVHGAGQVGPEGRSHGVAGLGPVEPQRGDVTVAFDGEDLEIGHGGHSLRRRRSARTAHDSGPGPQGPALERGRERPR